MSLRAKYLLWLVLASLLALALVALACYALWADLQPHERSALAAILGARTMLLVMLALLPPLVIGTLLRLVLAAYPQAAVKLAEEVRLIHSVHPAHRLAPTGAAEMHQLGAAVNELADAHRTLQQDVQARIDEAKAHLAQERNRLAALMSELAQSVLVCNSEGRILLYNARASRLLEQADEAEVPVGLGRSIFGILDRSPIIHALGQLGHRLKQGTAQPVARFVTTRGGRLLRAQVAPVLDQQGAISGFVLILEDITRAVEDNSRRDQLLQHLTEGSRAALANLRAAAETMQQYPEMDAPRRQRFFEVIADEAGKLSRRLEEALATQGDAPRTPWLLEDMLADDLVFALRGSLPDGPKILDEPAAAAAPPLWLSVNSYAMVQALSHLATRLAAAFGLAEVGLELGAVGRWVRLSLCWPAGALDPALLHEWENQPLAIGAVAGAATLKQVLDQHGAEIWFQGDAADARQRLCLQLPAAQPEQAVPLPRAHGGRPVYYDFDLFSQPVGRPELDDRPLGELTYTVFDTETTGLDPSSGDEIISIGAVRILNGRLLEQEFFDRLVRPRTAVRRESQAIHGIAPSMLAGQPFIEKVLPAFQRFAEDTVLVAHNAAFDMRLLQIAQERTGVVFAQPVLDTLLLSALVHPGHADDHRLEQIAARLGVQVIGRHTALGDAIVTGEVFLKLVPLLAERGIRTLKQAREASQRTAYAKLEY
ncbi:MAG: exonuclease domain-containing protein [Ramlibacter sp.]|nr:exonuclease domain-containing protein [Ramlibacter sp.]